MPKRSPKRDQARELWEKSEGKKTIKELSQELNVSESMLRKWKSQDKWTAKKPRGAPKGNKNAAGHKGPAEPGGQGNRNAETHGAYARPKEEKFTPEQRETVDQIRDRILRAEVAKYFDLQNRIAEIQDMEQEKFVTGGIDGQNSVEYWDSKRKWIETLEQRSIKILGRIQKFFDQQQTKEAMEQQKYLSMAQMKFQREKAIGVFEDGEPEETEGD